MKNCNTTRQRVTKTRYRPPAGEPTEVPTGSLTRPYPGSWEGRRNRIRCLHCQDVIESTHQHDFKHCKCGKVGIDGGALGHWRRLWSGGSAEDNFMEMP